ncbi:hypothetical protein, partial [Nocardia abscessus]|uniref:hypothetical protein n=1 Tax=Nocardia abscessus TaxID=120957 RepID=UPI002457992D
MTDQRRLRTRNPRFGPGGAAPTQAEGISVTRNHDVIRRWAEQRGGAGPPRRGAPGKARGGGGGGEENPGGGGGGGGGGG